MWFTAIRERAVARPPDLSDDARAVRALVARVARRLWLASAVRRLLRVTAAGCAVTSVVLLAQRFGFVGHQHVAHLIALVVLAAAILMIPGLRWVRTSRAAALIDAVYALGERFTTAVEVIGQPGAAARLVVRDAARCSVDVDPRRLARNGNSRDLWLAVLSVAVAAVLWLQASDRYEPVGDPQAGTEASGAVAGDRSARRLPSDEPARPPAPERQAAARELLLKLGVASTSFESGPSAESRQGSGGLGRHEMAGRAAPDPGIRRDAVPSLDQRRSQTDPRSMPAAKPPVASAGQGAEDSAERGLRPPGQSGRGMMPAVSTPGRDGAATEGGGGSDGPGSSSSKVASDPTGVAGGRSEDAGGAGPAERHGPRDSRHGERVLQTPRHDDRDVQGVLARAAVPPALRQYVLRYYDQLRRHAETAP